MDALSMILVLIMVGFFNFIAIGVFAYNSRGRQKVLTILASSGIYAIALVLFYFDVKCLVTGYTNIYLTFTTCFSVFIGLSLFVKSLTYLYQVDSKFYISVHILFAIVMSSWITFVSFYGHFLYRSFLFYGAICVLLFIALYYQYKSKITTLYNLISIQIYSILLLIIINGIFYIFYSGELSLASAPNFTKVFLSLVNYLILTSIFSFIIEQNRYDTIELSEKGLLLESMFDRAKVISETDELTQVFNRRKMKQILDLLMANYIRTNSPFVILLLDIDKFKFVNDSYGHEVGDEVLIHVTNILKHATRDGDFIGRWGGDEFIIVLSNTTYENGLIVKSKIQILQKEFTKDDKIIKVRLSIGCAQVLHNLSIKEIVHQADMKLYEDKNK